MYRLYIMYIYIYVFLFIGIPLEKSRRHGCSMFFPCFFHRASFLENPATGHLRAVGFQSFIFWDFNISYFEDDASFNRKHGMKWDLLFVFKNAFRIQLKKGANSRSEITRKLCTVDINIYVCDKHAMYTYMKYILYPMRTVI